MEKPNITVRVQASGITQNGFRIELSKEGPAEEFERMKRDLNDMFYRNDAKPLESEEGEQQKEEPYKSRYAD